MQKRFPSKLSLAYCCCLLALWLLFPPTAQAQEYRKGEQNEEEEQQAQKDRASLGKIRGSVIDRSTGEPLTGASIKVLPAKDGRGALTDVDGQYSLAKLKPGEYRLVVQYVSYKTDTSQSFELAPGEIEVVEFQLLPRDFKTQAIEIRGRQMDNTEVAMLAMQERSASLINGISQHEIQENGDFTAASAVRRVSGVTLEDGRYVYIRGLGDRYSKTMLNGSEIPSLDPNRNAVQMDLFPSNLLQNIVVYKTFKPDMPADFSGGLVNIKTRDFPNKFTLNISSSVAYNDQATMNSDFLSYRGGDWDWLGFDDGIRERPPELQGGRQLPTTSEILNDPEAAQRMDDIIDGFEPQMAPTRNAPPVNHQHSFSFGNQYDIGGTQLGVLASLSYRRQFQHFDGGEVGLYKLTGSGATELTRGYQLRDTKSNMNVLWGAMTTVSWKPGPNHKLRYNVMYNRSGNKFARFQQGPFPDDDPNSTRQNRVLGFTERAMNVNQLSGEHNFGNFAFPAANKLKLDWNFSYTRSIQDEPDLRFFTNDFRVNNQNDTIYNIQTNIYNEPSRYYRRLEENNYDARVNFTMPFRFADLRGDIKAGGALTTKDRSFREQRYGYNINRSFLSYDGDPETFFSPEIMGLREAESQTFNSFMRDVSQANPAYNGEQYITAAYVMADLELTERLRAVGMMRYEGTNIQVAPDREDAPQDLKGDIVTRDILPSASFVYSLRKKMNLRAVYGRTIARPTFRELAPFASFDFIGDFIQVGNPDIQRTLIDNVDLRWEWFNGIGEILSASLFFKRFQNPIERTLNPGAGGATPEIEFANTDQALNYGFELEVRQNLDFISPALSNFQLGGNFTYVQSRVAIDEDELEQIRSVRPNADDTRPMFMQSPYVLNLKGAYVNDNIGTSVTANFNVFGERLAGVAQGGTPNIFEQPRPQLRIGIQQRIIPRIQVSLSASNLLNPAYQMVHTFKGQEYNFSNYKLGRTYSFGVTYSIN